MFAFRCPSCGKQHALEVALDQPFQTRCLRCAEVIDVTPELIRAGEPQAATPDTRAAVSRSAPAGTGRHGPGQAVGTRNGDAGRAPRRDADEPGLAAEAEEGPVYDAQLNPKGEGADWADTPGAEEETDDLEVVQPANEKKGKPRPKRSPPPPPGEVKPRRWPVVVGVAALVLLLGGAGGGGYYWFAVQGKDDKGKKSAQKGDLPRVVSKGKGTPAPAAKDAPKAPVVAKDAAKAPVVAQAPPGGQAAPPAPKGPGPDKPAEATPIVQAKGPQVVRLSAARLAAELAADPAATNQKYEAVLLEVSGLFDKSEVRETIRPPARPHVLFAVEGAPVMGDLLGGKTDPRKWYSLGKGRAFTVRGVYGKDGVLHGADLLPLTPPADEKYKGKEVEITGFVEQARQPDPSHLFPRLVLEGDTNAVADIECLFRRTDEERVREVAVETPVIIRGACGGRHYDDSSARYVVRLDNCEIVYTTAPPAGVPRLPAAQLLRDYEEDLLTYAPQPAGAEERLESPVAVGDLEKDLAANANDVEKKYRHKLFAASGVLVSKDPTNRQLTLSSGDTNPKVHVRCRFTPRLFKELDDGPRFKVRGLCSALLRPTGQVPVLVLENCEVLDESGRRDPRRLTADFLPHTPGHALTYDLLQAPPLSGKPVVTRQLCAQKEGGLTETVVTHVGNLRGASLFDPGEAKGKWVTYPGARKLQQPGPASYHRLFGGFVQVGAVITNKDGQPESVWEPALKLGARAGESWKWTYANVVHEYTLVKFDTHEGQPSAVIQEVITPQADPHHPFEVRHVYAQGIGEVERREWLRVTQQDKQLLAERRLVEAPRPGAKPPIGPPAPGRAGEP